MFASFRTRFGLPGLIAVVALVFAMVGGAYAANKFVITSTKQIKPSVLKALQGKPGPAGLAGQNGTSGANGKDGTNGANGKDGASVTNAAIPVGNAKCEERGGTEFKVGASAATFACNGEEGSPWTAEGTLPQNATETGAWQLPTGIPGEEGSASTVLSFPVPLAEDVTSTGADVEFLLPGAASTTNCPGTAADPAALPGKLCVYAGALFPSGPTTEVSMASFNPSAQAQGNPHGFGRTGSVLSFTTTETSPAVAIIWGTWAVTAP